MCSLSVISKTGGFFLLVIIILSFMYGLGCMIFNAIKERNTMKKLGFPLGCGDILDWKTLGYMTLVFLTLSIVIAIFVLGTGLIGCHTGFSQWLIEHGANIK